MTTPRNGRELCLLSLDGGGVRGLSSLHILRHLMSQINPENPPEPWEYFDMIGGTSTGGLIAIMLGRLRMSITDCIKAYGDLSKQVFQKQQHRIKASAALPWNWEVQGRYSSDALEQAIKNILASRGLDENELLYEAGDPPCKIFVCVTSKDTSKTIALTSYPSRRWPSDLLKVATIWQAGRATAAATSFFSPTTIGPDDETFIDGATGANNPVWEVCAEARVTWKGDGPLHDNIKCLVSIGTGMPSIEPFGDTMKEIGEKLVKLATDTEMVAEAFARNNPDLEQQGRYFRFNVLHGLENIGLEEYNKRTQMVAATRVYLAAESTRIQMDRCVENLSTREWQSVMLIQIKQSVEKAMESLHRHLAFSYIIEDCKWLTESLEYMKWQSYPQSLLLWYHDPPASGKSTTLSLIISDIMANKSANNTSIAFFFCQLVGNRVLSISYLLRSIIAQLFTTNPTYIWELYAELCPNQSDNTALYTLFIPHRNTIMQEREVEKELWTLLSQILHLPSYSKTRIFIDGLDEFDHEIRMKFLAQLYDFVGKNKDVEVKVLLSSRPSQETLSDLPDVIKINSTTESNHCRATLYFQAWDGRRSTVRKSVPGTYSWLSSHSSFVRWIRGDANMLWIQGKPGSGKSTLAKFILQKLQVDSNLQQNNSRAQIQSSNLAGVPPVVVDFFYSARNGVIAMSHHLMLKALLYQLLRNDPALYKYFRETFRRIRLQLLSTTSIVSLSDMPVLWSYQDLAEVLGRLSMIASDQRRIYCVLDAMDESEDGVGADTNRAETLKVLSQIATNNKNVLLKFLVLSRPSNDIEQRLRPFPQIILEDNNGGDIDRVIDAGLRDIKLCINEWNSEDKSDNDTNVSELDDDDFVYRHAPASVAHNDFSKINLDFIRDHLRLKANGIILWVVLVLNEILLLVRGGSYSIADINERLLSLPTDLASLYQEIVDKLMEGLRSEDTLLARYIFTWCCFPQRSLMVNEFGDALAMFRMLLPTTKLENSSFEEFLTMSRIHIIGNNWMPVKRHITKYCGGLVEITSPDTVRRPMGNCKRSRLIRTKDSVQVIHQSVGDFLMSNANAGPFYLQPAREWRQTLSQVCITYLQNSFLLANLDRVYDLSNSRMFQWEHLLKHFVQYLENLPLLPYILAHFEGRVLTAYESECIDRFFSALKSQHRQAMLNFLRPWGLRLGLYLPEPLSGLASRRKGIAKLQKEFRQCFPEIVQSTDIGPFQELTFTTACEMGCSNTIRLLSTLTRGAFTSQAQYLCNAIERRNQNFAKQILETMMEFEDPRGDSKASFEQALHTAACLGQWSIWLSIIKTGRIEFAVQNSLGESPIHYAVRSGKLKLVKYVLGKSAPIDILNKDNKTGLAISVDLKDRAMATFLLQRGAGRPLLELAALREDSMLAEILLKLDSEEYSLETRTPFSVDAYYKRHPPIIHAINEFIATSTAKSIPLNPHAPLHVAAFCGNTETARFFLDVGIDIDAEREFFWTPLMDAIVGRHLHMVEFLLNRDANVNMPDANGDTPLHIAARRGSIDTGIINLLLNYGADSDIENFDGRLPLEVQK